MQSINAFPIKCVNGKVFYDSSSVVCGPTYSQQSSKWSLVQRAELRAGSEVLSVPMQMLSASAWYLFSLSKVGEDKQ